MHEQPTFFDEYVRPVLGYIAGLGVLLFRHLLDRRRDREKKRDSAKHKRAKGHTHGK